MNEATRRDFLSRLAKAGLFLPVLESVPKLSAQGKIIKRTKSPIKLVCINVNLGFSNLYDDFTPKSEGYAYVSTKILKSLQDSGVPHTVVSYTTHNINRGHGSSASVWTAHNPQPGKWIGQRISLDQVVAEKYRGETYRNYVNFTDKVSFNKKGVGLGSYRSPMAAITDIFRPIDKRKASNIYQNKQNLVAVLNKKVRILKKGLSKRDSDRIGDYIEALNEIERLGKEEYNWSQNFEVPKAPELPIVDSYMERYKSKHHSLRATFFEATRLLFQADITRVASVGFGNDKVKIDLPGLTENWHTYTHHGGRGDKRDPLRRIDEMNMRVITDFVVNLDKTRDEFGASLLDSTIVLVGSGMGNANRHSAKTIPFIAIGGGLKHKGHVSFEKRYKAGKKTYLANTYVELLQYMGLEVEKFGNSNGVSNIWS